MNKFDETFESIMEQTLFSTCLNYDIQRDVDLKEYDSDDIQHDDSNNIEYSKQIDK
jgi:hypothetical protein